MAKADFVRRAVRSASSAGRTTVLLTGFGPFPGVAVNATMILVPKLAQLARQQFPGVEFVADVLPTEWVAAPKRVNDMLKTYRPDVVLHFGVSSRARGFEIETRGLNVCAMAPDAVGALPKGERIALRGPDEIRSLLPVADIVQRLRRRGLKAYASRDAGTYLCNRTLFHVLSMERKYPELMRAGFIHVPSSLVAGGIMTSNRYLRSGPASPLSWRGALVGGLDIIGGCLAQPVRIDVRSVNRIA
ncbi:MAG: pyroglutamyl-peptidase I [Hyphomicrobiaceae bacterium]|nr:pyroglutamyl-peptidase I [Hyphomicrobiaceae bacterium]